MSNVSFLFFFFLNEIIHLCMLCILFKKQSEKFNLRRKR